MLKRNLGKEYVSSKNLNREAKRSFAIQFDMSVEVKDPERHLKLRAGRTLTVLEY